MELTATEIRTLGSLIEKSITTPDYYPLTLNALTAACNQKSNRDPVVGFDEKTVVKALDNLRDRKLVWMLTAAGNRVPKYEHRAAEGLSLTAPELAVLCTLMLRGPQTVGEIKSRTQRLHDFQELEAVEAVLAQLLNRDGPTGVAKLPRQPGRKEPRYMHRLAGEPEVASTPDTVHAEPARLDVEQDNERITALERDAAALREQLVRLRQDFESFREQFR